MREELLEYCYKHQRQYVYDIGQREFESLIFLVEEGDIQTYEELAVYGMNY